MLGRLTHDILNEFVVAFNSTISQKYKFISSYATQLSNDTDYKRFQAYKSHETPETKGIIIYIYLSLIIYLFYK